MRQGFAHLVLLLIFLFVVVGVVVYVLWSKNVIKLPGVTQKPTVALRETYQNPFDKKSQYINPFDTYKSPFAAL